MSSEALDFEALATSVNTIAEKAGDLLKKYFEEEVEVFEKEDGSPVTIADQSSHMLIKEGLEIITPDIPVISEEDPDSWAIENTDYWLVDPLDGTKGFIYKTGEFCINIALIKNHHPIFGLIHIPLTQETYIGYGNQAYRLAEGEKHSLHSRQVPPEGMTLLLGGYGKAFLNLEDFLRKTYPIHKLKRIRSAIKFCALASGQADLYVRFTECYEWDTAAGHAIVEAAGGSMTKIDGSPFPYGKPNRLTEGFVVFGTKP